MPVLSTVGAASLRAFGAFGLQGSAASFIAATGGSVTTSGNYKYHTFGSSGTLSVTAAPAGKYIDVLLVGGGGASGGNLSGGGGGGVIINEGVEIGLGSYGITIGSAGNGVGVSGGNTTAFDLVALGGGGGGISGYSGSWVAGKSGGSGGGAGVIFGGPSASPISTPAGAGLQPTSESGGFGNNGGVGVPYPVGTGYGMVGAAGGGAGGAASGNTAGVGKSGLPLSSNLFGAGGAYDTQATQYGGGGGDISYNGYALGGIVIVRYLYQ